jgi:hypothetical protein
MNPTLLAREAAADRGSLDPRPEPRVELEGPTRLLRVVDERGEVWIEPKTGRRIEGGEQ